MTIVTNGDSRDGLPRAVSSECVFVCVCVGGGGSTLPRLP